MTGRRRRRLPWVVWLLVLTAALLVPGTGPAGAHDHPTPTERAAPGVVFVQAGAEVEVSLVEHLQSDPAGVHIRIIQSTSTPVLASASGFAVDPTGAIVTSGAITQTDLERARVYAINQAFQQRYGAAAPLAGDPFTRQQIGAPTDRLQQRLEACYPPHTTNDAGGCVVRVTPTYVIYPYVSSQEQFGQLPAELLPGSTPDVAVLRVRGASGMPTVALGESTEGAQALAVLGFTGIPEGADTLQAINSHLAESGGTVLKSEDLTEAEAEAAVELAPAVQGGLRGGPVIAEQGQVVGFLEPEASSGPPPATAGRLVDVGTIREVLSAAGITPRRGPVDTSFERASHPFKNGGYAAAIPNLEATLELFPGHALAAAYLAEAQQNVAEGTTGPARPEGGSSASGGEGAGFPWAVVLVVVAAVVLLAVAAYLVLRRRRGAPGPAGVAASPGSPKAATAKSGPAAAKPGPARPSAATPREGRPKESTHSEPTRSTTGLRARGKAPGGGTGSPVGGAVSVIEDRNSGAGGSPSRSVPGQRAADGTEDGGRGASRSVVAQVPNSASGPDAAYEPVAAESQAFCTSCGAALGPHHRFCGRCGRPTG